MIHGSCLCGDVQFEIERVAGPFELCHCARCRKVSGSAFMAGVYVRREDFRFTRGRELIKTYEAPILREPPAYRVAFCPRCGSPVPDPDLSSEQLEIAAGLLEGELGVRPDRHIFVHVKSTWFEITDALPQLNLEELEDLRR